MEYNEQFIRLNCSLMSDYRMMKLNAEMKSIGIGVYVNAILFLRKQREYKHDFNELDLLAEQWGVSVEDLRHLILDFDLFVLTDDGYFRCIYLDEVMDYQNMLSEQRAAAGSKGGKSSKKTTAKSPQTTPKNTAERKAPANQGENTLQLSDNETNATLSQASDKQSFKREEKNREEKNKKDDVDIIKENIGGGNDEASEHRENASPTPLWEQYIDEAFASQSWLETVGMMSGLKRLFLDNLPFIASMFKKHVVAQGSTGRINSLAEAQSYFSNYVRTGKPTRLFLEEKLKEKNAMKDRVPSFSPYENYDPQADVRSYCGIPLPKDAPPRPNGRASWDELNKRWI